MFGFQPDLRLVLDLEQGNPKKSYGDWAHRFAKAIREHLGHYPVFYSYGPYIDGMELARWLGMLPPMDSAGERAMISAFNLATKARRAMRERFG